MDVGDVAADAPGVMISMGWSFACRRSAAKTEVADDEDEGAVDVDTGSDVVVVDVGAAVVIAGVVIVDVLAGIIVAVCMGSVVGGAIDSMVG